MTSHEVQVVSYELLFLQGLQVPFYVRVTSFYLLHELGVNFDM